MNCISVKEEYHGYVRLYPNTKENIEKIADAITKLVVEQGFSTVAFDGEEEKFKAKSFAKNLAKRLEAQDFRVLNEDFFSFEFGDIRDFDELPEDYYGF